MALDLLVLDHRLDGLLRALPSIFPRDLSERSVGDGSIYPPLLNRDLSCMIRERHRISKGIPVNETMKAEVAKNYNLHVPNPLHTLVIIADKESALILACGGLVVACIVRRQYWYSITVRQNLRF